MSDATASEAVCLVVGVILGVFGCFVVRAWRESLAFDRKLRSDEEWREREKRIFEMIHACIEARCLLKGKR